MKRKKAIKVAIHDMEHLKRVRPFLAESLDLAIERMGCRRTEPYKFITETGKVIYRR